MKFRTSKYLILALCALLSSSRIVPAQTQLPPLTTDPRIQRGTLGSGITYYMVTDPSVKGYADVAIVQRDEPLSEAKRGSINSRFLSRMGIGPGPEGFLTDEDGSTVYRFGHVPFYRPEVLDSTLLYTFALVAQSKAQQAVIVSGDIDAPELKKKMDIFSMLVPRMLVKENHRPDYVWEPSPAPSVQIRTDGAPLVSVSYAGARIPFAYMNTAQALVTDLFGLEFQVLLQHRLERNLRDEGIPHGAIRFKAVRSADYGGDERYTVQVQVAPERLHEAMRVISSTVAEMDAYGVKPDEFADAKKVLAPHLYDRAASAPRPGELVNRCVAHFLYGANLAPYSETIRLFSRKNMADSTEARLFNGFSGALLEQLANLTLEYTGAPDSLDRDQELFYYNLSYLYGSVIKSYKDYSWRGHDTLGFNFSCPKVKIRSEKREPVTGGTIWTFSNGMRVIYKQVSGDKLFHYALQLNGGLSQIDGLQEGEGGYIGDLLALYDAGGVPAWHFREVLEVGGVSMDAKVDLNSMSIQGRAPSAQLSFLLRSLLELTGNGRLNQPLYELYRRQQSLHVPETEAQLNFCLAPGYAWSGYKNPAALQDDTWQKAEKFYAERFARMNDGVLILSGDLQEESVKKILCRYLGGFRVQKGTTPRRLVEYSPLSGTVTFTESGPEKGVYVLMDAEYPLTSDHFYTGRVAAEALREILVRHLAGYGFTCDVEVSQKAHPQERFQLLVSCRPVPLESLPADVDEVSAQRALTAVRAAIREAGRYQPEEVDLNLWKSKLEGEVQAVMASSSGFSATLLARYALNKDMTSRYRESIAAVSADSVMEFLATLSSGGRVEYLVP